MKRLLPLAIGILFACTLQAQLVRITAYGTVNEVTGTVPDASITTGATASFSATVDFNDAPYINNALVLGYRLRDPIFKIGNWETLIGTDFSWLTFAKQGNGSQEIEMESDDSNNRIGYFFLVTGPNAPILERSLPIGDLDLSPFNDLPLHFQWIRNSPPYEPFWFMNATVNRVSVTEIVAVPEPSTWGVAGSSMILGLIVMHRRVRSIRRDSQQRLSNEVIL